MCTHFGQMIAIQSLHNLAQTFMRIVLLIPHVLVVLDLALIIQRQGNKTVYRLGVVYESGCVFLLQLEDDAVFFRLDDFGLEGLRLGHYFGDAVPLASDLVACVAV
jgi:hypothetical protein